MVLEIGPDLSATLTVPSVVCGEISGAFPYQSWGAQCLRGGQEPPLASRPPPVAVLVPVCLMA